jgi:OFA family oxalate/formate antiporter-like MFS transporter
MNRYLILVAAVIMQICLGATYSWSIYVQPLRQMTGLMQGTAQLPFTLFYFAFPATMMLAGNLLPRWGPRRCAMLGGLLFGSGWLLAGLGGIHFAMTVLGIGALAGIGAGFAYIVPIATCIRWFPDRKGLVTGVAVAGFGGGAAVVSQIGGLLMNRLEWTPFTTFTAFGGAFLALVSLAGSAMLNPPAVNFERPRRLPAVKIISAGPFGLLYAAMLTGLAAGFAVNANLKDLYASEAVGSGIAAVSLFALANAAGRIGWGGLCDRLPAVTMIRINLISQAVVLLLSALILRSESGLLLFALLTGFNYGGVLVIYASAAARIWGAENVGQTYSWLFSSNIPAAAAPIIAGYSYDFSGSFYPALIGIALFMTGAAIIVSRSGFLGDGPARGVDSGSAIS